MPSYPKKTEGKKRSSASRSGDYDSDNGFVANGSDDGGPRKKAKSTAKRAPPKRTEEEEFWELTDKRRVQISEFKGKQMVNIREFYEKDGEMLPGKKGISLTVAQYNTIVELLPQIEASLVAKGETVSRPDYDGKITPSGDTNEGGEAEVEAGEAGGKKNFEATSEEEV